MVEDIVWDKTISLINFLIKVLTRVLIRHDKYEDSDEEYIYDRGSLTISIVKEIRQEPKCVRWAKMWEILI